MVLKHDEKPNISKPNINYSISQLASLDFKIRHVLIRCESENSLTDDMIFAILKKFNEKLKSELIELKSYKGDLDIQKYPDVSMFVAPSLNFYMVAFTMTLEKSYNLGFDRINDQTFCFFIEKFLLNKIGA